jgi:flavodoxin
LFFSVLTHYNIQQADAYIFACGTYGHGVLQEHMEKFLISYNKDFDFNNKPCSVVGLGDNKYDNEYNIESAYILSDFVTTHNGVMCIEALKINKSPLIHLHNRVESWLDVFTKSL